MSQQRIRIVTACAAMVLAGLGTAGASKALSANDISTSSPMTLGVTVTQKPGSNHAALPKAKPDHTGPAALPPELILIPDR